MVEQHNPEPRAVNPFPGLRPFNTDESLLFFGRDGLSDALLEKLRATRFVAVVGTSGSGKSSLVRAGLLPALRGGFMPNAGSGWRVALFRPINNPIGNLAYSLFESGVLPADAATPPSERLDLIGETLRRSSLGLIEVVRLAGLSRYENVLIVADQFEELYRFEPSSEVEHPREEASAFVKLLLEAKQQTEIPIYVILTMRSDYLGESAHFWGLPEAINSGQFLIPRMDDDERREAIEGPIRVRGATISWALVNRLLNDAGDDPRQLPILQHALMRSWDHWEKHNSKSEPIAIKNYSAVGGMGQALSIHADEAFEELTSEQKVIAEKMFKRLTEKGAGKREGRLPATVSEIREVANVEEKEILSVIEAFRKEGRSFLMPPSPTPLTSMTLIDISHESLISGWARLRKWVEDEGDSAKTYARLVDDALRYPEDTKLLTNPELQSALNWHEREKPNEAWAKRYYTDFGKALVSDKPPPRPEWADADATEYGIATKYLALSEADWQRTKALKDSKRRRKLTLLTIAAGAFLILAVFAIVYAQIAEVERSNAVEAKKAAVEATERATAGEQAAETARIISDISKATAVNLQSLADAQANKAQAALLVAERERQLAESQGKQLRDFAELGKANDKVLAAILSHNTFQIVPAYQSMRKVYGRPGIHKTANQDTLDDLTVDAIFGDGIRSVSDAFPYFKQKYMRSFGGQPNSLAGANIAFAQAIIESQQRDGVEAVEFLRSGIKLLDDKKDAEQKASAFAQLGKVYGISDEAIPAFSEAVRLFHSRDKADDEAAAREKFGETYRKRGEPDKALVQYNEALKLFDKVNDRAGTGRIRKQILSLGSP
jgi:tetratricopeptide (TPR) repeat protein